MAADHLLFRRILPIVSCALLLAPSALAQKIEIKTENGVRVVSNPSKPVPQKGGPSSLTLVEDLVIGRTAADKPLFGELRSVGADGDGYIWTLDWQDYKIRVFDRAGNLVSAFGRRGQGPGEWQGLMRMVVLPEGTAAVLDVTKIAFHSRDGTCLREPSIGHSSMMIRMRLDSKGNVYGDVYDFGRTPNMTLKKFGPDMAPLSTITRIEEAAYDPQKINVFTTILLYHVDARDRLTWAVNTKYEFHILSPEGRELVRFARDTPRLSVSGAAKERLLAEMGERRSRYVVPDQYPPFSTFIGDPEGRIYVRTYERDKDRKIIYDVFDPEGRFFTRFSLPEDEIMFAVLKDKMYIMIQEDEEGRPLVKRYAMAWK